MEITPIASVDNALRTTRNNENVSKRGTCVPAQFCRGTIMALNRSPLVFYPFLKLRASVSFFFCPCVMRVGPPGWRYGHHCDRINSSHSGHECCYRFDYELINISSFAWPKASDTVFGDVVSSASVIDCVAVVRWTRNIHIQRMRKTRLRKAATAWWL